MVALIKQWILETQTHCHILTVIKYFPSFKMCSFSMIEAGMNGLGRNRLIRHQITKENEGLRRVY